MSEAFNPNTGPQLTPEQEGMVAEFEHKLEHDMYGNPVDPNGTLVDPSDDLGRRNYQGSIVESAANNVWYYQDLLKYARNDEDLPLDSTLQSRLRGVKDQMRGEIAGRVDNPDYLEYLGGAFSNEPLEDGTKSEISRGVGERMADDQAWHQQESTRLADGQSSNEVQTLIRDVLDGRVNALGYPYEKPATGSPEYKEDFQNLLNEIVNAAADGPANGEQWKLLRDHLAKQLVQALRDDKDQIVYVQNSHDLLRGHVAKAEDALGTATDKFDKAQNTHTTAKHRLATGDPTYGNKLLKEPPAGVLRIAPMPANHEVPPEMQGKYNGNAQKHWLHEVQAPRLREAAPFGRRGKREMERYLHRYEDTQVEARRHVNYASLDISAAETGDNGTIRNNEMLRYEIRKLSRFEEIIGRVDQLSAASDPDALQNEHGGLESEAQVAVYEAGMRNALLEWRHNNTPEADHEVFVQMNRARNYLNDVVQALDGMSTHNRRYARLLTMHNNIRRIHNTGAHHIMLQRWENATNDNGNFRGRYPVHFMPDMGIYQEDGSGDIYYPDGSTARVTGMNPDGSERVKRLDHNGYYWVEPENEDDQQQSRRRGWRGLLNRLSGEQTEAPITSTVHELRSETEKLADLTFVDPTDKNRENTARHASAWATEARTELDKNLDRDVAKARNQARAIAEQEARDAAQAAGEEYDAEKAATKIEAAMIRAGRDARKDHVPDGDLTVHYNVATYQTYFHGFRPGEPQLANGPHIRNDGAIILPGHHFYDRDADWALWPNGALEELDAAGNAVKSYTNDGKLK
jgi:hypothetical protein